MCEEMIINSAASSVTYKIKDFDIDIVLDCGQSFRWEQVSPFKWHGVAFARKLEVIQDGDKLIFNGTNEQDFNEIWYNYFDLGRDYSAIKLFLSQDKTLAKAIEFSPGLRLIKQQPWEALCSFIVSQNNNIPRIKGIISRMCECFGEKIEDGVFAFPTPQSLAICTEQDLAPLRSGFRAGYILDAAKKVASGEICLEDASVMPLDEARASLMTIRGVGPKVAECALLFGCGRVECFPIDVWIKRVLSCLYPKGFPTQFEEIGGIAQQYLFHYARCCPSCELVQKEA
jgi:N-glycosylase/DNA lyase